MLSAVLPRLPHCHRCYSSRVWHSQCPVNIGREMLLHDAGQSDASSSSSSSAEAQTAGNVVVSARSCAIILMVLRHCSPAGVEACKWSWRAGSGWIQCTPAVSLNAPNLHIFRLNATLTLVDLSVNTTSYLRQRTLSGSYFKLVNGKHAVTPTVTSSSFNETRRPLEGSYLLR